MGEILKVRDLKMVDVRKYEGVQDGMEAWTFLGYDIVSFDEEGKAVSVVAEEETKYDVLKKAFSKQFNREYYDHSGLAIGDVRAKVVEDSRTVAAFIWNVPRVTRDDILAKIDKQPGFYFLHHNDDTKVKKMSK